jgi:hypothetical protein
MWYAMKLSRPSSRYFTSIVGGTTEKYYLKPLQISLGVAGSIAEI